MMKGAYVELRDIGDELVHIGQQLAGLAEHDDVGLRLASLQAALDLLFAASRAVVDGLSVVVEDVQRLMQGVNDGGDDDSN